MKVLTAAEMREVDRRTIELGIPSSILMENAGHRVVEFLAEQYGPLSQQRIVILCGSGNNGGDGMVAARQLFTRFRPQSLYVVAAAGGESEARRMLTACGCLVHQEISAGMRNATLVVDALLGFGLEGAVREPALSWIREINNGFPLAKVVAVDLPSGMQSDSGVSEGEVARADATITFTALKLAHALSPNCDRMGTIGVKSIGSPPHLLSNTSVHLSEPADFAHLLAPRVLDSNKGRYGHVLVIGGAEGKFGAAEMTGLAALRGGAGLVTVASSAPRLTTSELMTEPFPATREDYEAAADKKDVLAIGPGLGSGKAAVDLARHLLAESPLPIVFDADGLNAIAGQSWSLAKALRVLTPHPGEMSRLLSVSIAEIQGDRLSAARSFAQDHGAIVLLKGHRSVIALPDGRIWINPTGTPALATAGTGDILTGLIAAFLAQFPEEPEAAVIAAAYLHGRAGQLAAAALGEISVIATDLLRFLPEAIREAATFQ